MTVTNAEKLNEAATEAISKKHKIAESGYGAWGIQHIQHLGGDRYEVYYIEGFHDVLNDLFDGHKGRKSRARVKRLKFTFKG